MRSKLWSNKWFILSCIVVLFLLATSAKVALAGTDTQLDKVLKAGLDGLAEYFKFLLDTLKVIW